MTFVSGADQSGRVIQRALKRRERSSGGPICAGEEKYVSKDIEERMWFDLA
jgi:hypothetical protein